MSLYLIYMYLIPTVGLLLSLLIVASLGFLAFQGVKDWLAKREPKTAGQTRVAGEEAR